MAFSQNDFFLSFSSANISAYVASMYTKLSSYTLSSVLKIFSVGFVNKSFLAWFMWHFSQKQSQNRFVKAMDSTVYLDFLGNESIYPEFLFVCV